MAHKHEFETVSRPGVAPEAGSLGIKAVELRKCRTCEKLMPFILVRDEWVALFEDRESDKQDILLA